MAGSVVIALTISLLFGTLIITSLNFTLTTLSKSTKLKDNNERLDQLTVDLLNTFGEIQYFANLTTVNQYVNIIVDGGFEEGLDWWDYNAVDYYSYCCGDGCDVEEYCETDIVIPDSILPTATLDPMDYYILPIGYGGDANTELDQQINWDSKYGGKHYIFSGYLGGTETYDSVVASVVAYTPIPDPETITIATLTVDSTDRDDTKMMLFASIEGDFPQDFPQGTYLDVIIQLKGSLDSEAGYPNTASIDSIGLFVEVD